jgi:hypothetical protein
MSPIPEAYERLLGIADRSDRDYRYRDIYPDRVTAEDNIIIGTGYDYASAMFLPSRAADLPPVVGLAQLRLVLLAHPEELRLYLHSRLTWPASAGGSHGSLAVYEITPAVAVELSEVAQPRQHDIGEWRQTYPGDPGAGSNAVHHAETLAYHAEVIRASKEAEPDLLCMLSDADTGRAELQHLERLLRWIRDHKPGSALEYV